MVHPRIVLALLTVSLALTSCGNPFGAEASQSDARAKTAAQTQSPTASATSASGSASASGSSSPSASAQNTPSGNTVTTVSPSEGPSGTATAEKEKDDKKDSGSSSSSQSSGPNVTTNGVLDAPIQSNMHDTSPAVAGTACGSNTIAANSMVHIAKAERTISCDTAQTIIDAYETELKAHRTGGNAVHATVHGYHCSSPTAAASEERAIISHCESEDKKVELTVRRNSVPMLSGTNNIFGGSTSLITPNENAACNIERNGTVRCQSTLVTNPAGWNDSRGKAQNRVYMGAGGSPEASLAGRNDPGGTTDFRGYQTLPTGTTVTRYGVTCKSSSGSTMHCVGAQGGFTISPDGIGIDPR